jgi:4'-phosphopantetheinyl transferase
MSAPGWLTRCEADVPAGDDWLGDAERRALAALRFPVRRASWRLGRWTAKAAVGAWLGAEPAAVQVLAAEDGAPEAWVGGRRAPVSLSLSHRAGRALAAVADAPAVVGCDLELVEPRSDAFVREWLSPGEQALVAGRRDGERAELVNLLWTAKEAAAKVCREGLRLPVRDAVARPAAGAPAAWGPLHVAWEAAELPGWWRAEDGWVMAVVARGSAGRPQPIGRE